MKNIHLVTIIITKKKAKAQIILSKTKEKENVRKGRRAL